MADKEVEIKVVTNADTEQVENLEDVLEEAKNSADDLSNSIEDMDSTNVSETAEEFDNLGTNADDATSSTDSVSDSIDGINATNVGDAAAEFDNLGESADSADNEIQELQSSMDLIEAGALMGIAGELSSIGANAEGMAQEMNTAAISVGQLATQTGIAEPQMISLVNTISNATFPNEEAMQYIQVLDQLGVSSNNLGAAATNMDRINDAFGIGSSAVVTLTGNLYAMGVPADNLQSSFNALAYAQSNVVGGVEKFNTILQRLGPSFTEYGYNVDQAAIISAAATQKWGSGRKAMSELSSALKDAGGDARALEQALGLQAGALDNATQKTGEYEGQLQALADEEAQHKTIIDQLGAAWEDVSLSLSPILSPLASVVGLIGQAGSFAVGINGILQLAETFGLLKTANLALIPTQIAEGTAGWFSIGWIALAIALGIALGLAFIYLYENCDWFREAVNNLASALQWLVGLISDSVMGTIQWLSEEFQNFTSQLGLNTDDWIQAIVGFILFLPQLPLYVGQLLLDTIAQALGFGDNFTETMMTSAANGVNGFISAITGFPGWVWNILVSAYNRVVQFVTQFVSGLVNGAVRAVNGFSNAVQGIPRAIQSCLDWAYNIVMNHPIVQALIWLGNQAAYAFSALGLGQRSPGKIVKAMRQELDWTKEAIEDSNLPSVTATLGGNVASSFNPDLNTSSTTGGAGGVGNTYNINLTVGSVDKRERVEEIIDTIRDYLEWDNARAGRTV